MDPDITQLAKMMRARRDAGVAPYTLLLGSSLSLTPAVRRAVCDSEDWETFWTAMEKMSPAERRAAFKGPLERLLLVEGYRALTRLLAAGYYEVVFTLNVDDTLDNALRVLETDEYRIWVHGEVDSAKLVAALEYREPRVKVLKLRGDINAHKLPLTPERQFEFPPDLEGAVRQWLSRDTIVVGDLSFDDDVWRCMRWGKGALWTVQTSEVSETSGVLRGVKEVRKKGEVITVESFNVFFTALANALEVEEVKPAWVLPPQNLYQGRSVGQGLTALAELMQMPGVRAAVVAFQTDFQAAREQITVVSNHKDMHDLLHTLQFHCYNPIVQEARRFPDDDMAVDNLMDYELTLQRIVNDLKDAAERASFETLWTQDLVKAQEALARAIEELNAKLLKRAIWLLNRVLAIQPSQINKGLNAAARALRLPALVKAMADVSDNLARLDLDPEKVSQFETGVDALVSLNLSLTTLVDDHDKWQAVDLELRRIEAIMGQDTVELEMSWPDLKAMTEPLYSGSTDEWATSFRKDRDNLDSAIKAANPAQIKRYFRRYRRQAGVRFHQVDVDLKRLCEDLRKVGEPMDSVMKMMGG